MSWLRFMNSSQVISNEFAQEENIKFVSFRMSRHVALKLPARDDKLCANSWLFEGSKFTKHLLSRSDEKLIEDK